jgi:hypothetical protein
VIIAIDESGTFVSAPKKNSWCIVSAYVFSERVQSRSFAALKELKKSSGVSAHQEIKLKNVSEENYFKFVEDLSKLGGVLFAVATDSHVNDNNSVIKHRTIQVNKIRENESGMIYKEGKKFINNLANELDSLSPQLYVQLQCQVQLLSDIFHRAFLYYVQRDAQTLRKYKWRIDQKNTTKTVYEKAFEKVVCPILQTISFREPMIFLEEADYSYMKQYLYSSGEAPKYAEEAFGKKLDHGVNIGKIVRDDMTFPDSKMDLSVQIADLLASGLRRCLRSEFTNNQVASKLLGSLMLDDVKNELPIKFVGFQEHEEVIDAPVGKIITIMKRASKGMLFNA